MDSDLVLFRELFWQGFSSLKFQSARFYNLRPSLEAGNDYLAGPFYHIYTSGDCDYVFQGKHKNFQDIEAPEDFLKWCMKQVDYFRQTAESADIENPYEAEDRKILMERVEIMEKLSTLAYEIQKKRMPPQPEASLKTD